MPASFTQAQGLVTMLKIEAGLNVNKALLVVANSRFRLLYRLLAREGQAQPLVANSLRHAIQLFQNERPSIIIADLDDPESHWNLQETVRQLAAWQTEHTLILCTSQASQWSRRHLPGAFVVAKPSVADDIIATVRALVSPGDTGADVGAAGGGSGLQGSN